LGQPLVHSLGLALSECFLVGFIREQGLFKLRQNAIRDADRLQDLPETVGPLDRIERQTLEPLAPVSKLRNPLNLQVVSRIRV
jgi:hypothetical protein